VTIDAAEEDDLPRVLQEEAESLQRLIEECKRLQREIYEHLDRLQHAGDGIAATRTKTHWS
jgi:hypothetical protein